MTSVREAVVLALDAPSGKQLVGYRGRRDVAEHGRVGSKRLA